MDGVKDQSIGMLAVAFSILISTVVETTDIRDFASHDMLKFNRYHCPTHVMDVEEPTGPQGYKGTNPMPPQQVPPISSGDRKSLTTSTPSISLDGKIIPVPLWTLDQFCEKSGLKGEIKALLENAEF
ncbi:hypothetical protein C8R45DRAFT_945386 [Mycena sanguinolenta]|nr:hypothetical protein C8R45DRAFT_945386 [Mycena sanguinolenta]